QFDRAADILRQNITTAQQTGAVADEAAFRDNLASTLHAQGKLSAAIQEQEAAIVILRRHHLPYSANGASVEKYEKRLKRWRESEQAIMMQLWTYIYAEQGEAGIRAALAGQVPDDVIEAIVAQLAGQSPT
ncbi:MAG: hypothetical protein H7Y11_09860, partial [Armatimonadetes bacterium]|nr:hypothetical protein [Anaerolineae bacterium]